MTIRYCWLGHSGVCVDENKPITIGGEIMGSVTTACFPIVTFGYTFGFVPELDEIAEVTIRNGKYEKRGYEFL